MTLSLQNGRLVWIVDTEFVDAGAAPLHTINMNEALYAQFFSGFPTEYNANTGIYTLNINWKPNQYSTNNTYTNPDGTAYGGVTFNFIDSFNSLSSWNLIRRVVLLTNNIQVNNETLSTKVYSASSSNANNAANLSILTDFEIPYVSTAVQKDYLFYQPHEYRYISVVQSGPLQKLDLTVFFEDPQTSTLYPLYMSVNTDFYLKALFRHKMKYRLE